jgi:hypothetical protein
MGSRRQKFRPGLWPRQTFCRPGYRLKRAKDTMAGFATLFGDLAAAYFADDPLGLMDHLGIMELSGLGSPTPTNQCWPES